MSAPLAALDPRWVTVDSGQRVGVSFACPACVGRDDSPHEGRVFVYVDPPLDPGPASPSPSWQRTGDTFDTLTVTPSIRVRVDDVGEHWHGFITNGQVTP